MEVDDDSPGKVVAAHACRLLDRPARVDPAPHLAIDAALHALAVLKDVKKKNIPVTLSCIDA